MRRAVLLALLAWACDSGGGPVAPSDGSVLDVTSADFRSTDDQTRMADQPNRADRGAPNPDAGEFTDVAAAPPRDADVGGADGAPARDTAPMHDTRAADEGVSGDLRGDALRPGDVAPPPPDGPELGEPELLCNGLDDDGDNIPDDGFECALGESGTCPTPCGSSGARTCIDGCVWTECVLPREVCNGEDDNCDGRIDETMPCRPGQARACRNGCGPEGIEECDDACRWRPCTGAQVSCEPGCIADPSGCRAPPTQCLLDADHDGWIDPGALELGPPELISPTNMRSWSTFRFAITDGGERVYGSWCETSEDDFEVSQCVIQEFDGQGRATPHRAVFPDDGRFAGDPIYTVGQWLLTQAGDVFDADLNRIGERLPVATPFGLGNNNFEQLLSWTCGDEMICVARSERVWIANLSTGESWHAETPQQGLGLVPSFVAPLPGGHEAIGYNIGCDDSGCVAWYSKWSTDGFEPILAPERVDLNEVGPDGAAVRQGGDPNGFGDVANALLRRALAASFGLSSVTLNGQTIATIAAIRDEDVAPGVARNFETVLRGPLTGAANIPIDDPRNELALSNWSGHLIGTEYADAERNTARIVEFRDGSSREIAVATRRINGRRWLDDSDRLTYAYTASGQLLYQHLRCTRERIVAHAP